MGLFVGLMMLVIIGTAASSPHGGAPPFPVFLFMAILMALFMICWSIPSAIAAYALLKRKPWAKVAGIIAGVFSAAQMPLGTAVSVYTFWFLFSEVGRSIYDRTPASLPPAPPMNWSEAGSANRMREPFVPGSSPPDWR